MPLTSIEEAQLPFDAAMLNGLADPVLFVDPRLVVVGCNRAAKQLLGDDALQAELGALLDNKDILTAVEASLGGTPGTSHEVFLPYPIARTFNLSIWRLPDLKSVGPAWAMMIFHDVTASKKAAQMRADFVANVSHELRSPLSALLGFIETLRGPARDDPAATERFLEIMESEAQRMTRLINDLLVLSKLETEEHIRPENAIDLRPVLTQVANILSVRATEREMNIVIDCPDGLASVQGDPDELVQVFQNLVANAISYGRSKTPIQVIATRGNPVPGTEDASVAVSVINQGEGIPVEDIPRLTERFYRVNKGRSRSMGGTGLGLAIVKHILARHRGHLEIESTPGERTVFTVSLPSVAV
ncbi:MAG: ATP-binding protein [Proteobacteria bacterium]|nr:ATP-binding protein [Pseudomonadota bacterium]MDA1308443.1 ATP-binding protein [Pseudomonadota bacterium]